MELSKSTFWGYRRENGRVGVRNHVVILPVDDLSNAAAQAVENNVKGTLALPHPYGRLQFGADLERSEEHTSELQSRSDLVCRLLLEKKKKTRYHRSASYHATNYRTTTSSFARHPWHESPTMHRRESHTHRHWSNTLPWCKAARITGP